MSLHFGAAAEPRSNGGKQRQASWEEASHNPYGDPGRKIQDRGQCSPKTVSHRDAHSGQGVGVPLLRRLRCAAGNQAAGAALISAIQKADCAEESGIYGKTGREQQAQAIFTKTIKEVAQGTMGGPYTHTELVQRHGPHYNVIPSFGLEQGVDESNKPKFRRIDDHTAGFTNLAAHRRQKIAMSMADYLVVMIKAMYNTSRCSLTVGTEDMKQAYRQIPLLDSQTSLAVTAIYNPHTQQPELYEIYGQPFGAGHSVPNFYRTAEWLNRVMIRAYKVMLDHFFIDFYYVERPACGKVTMFCLQQAFQPLGFSLDSEKTQVPSEVAYVLGVAFNTRVSHSERQLKVEPKPLHVQNFTVVLIDAILRRKALPPSVAASVLGKFGFLCSTLFGKLGRFCTAALRERQYSNTSSTHLTPAIILSLKLMKHVVQIAPHRVCQLDRQHPPIILYTDASDVPGRDPRYGLGGVMIV